MLEKLKYDVLTYAAMHNICACSLQKVFDNLFQRRIKHMIVLLVLNARESLLPHCCTAWSKNEARPN